ncbi:hypothetical protein, partial [Klebsiella pneumoniae]|uniref:hypothetical protein n=1 Tax=Klebsiella pneumoniae TaxID=573 RepID=UPI00272F644C
WSVQPRLRRTPACSSMLTLKEGQLTYRGEFKDDQYYLELRLNKARQMLMQTSKSIIQIGA